MSTQLATYRSRGTPSCRRPIHRVSRPLVLGPMTWKGVMRVGYFCSSTDLVHWGRSTLQPQLAFFMMVSRPGLKRQHHSKDKQVKCCLYVSADYQSVLCICTDISPMRITSFEACSRPPQLKKLWLLPTLEWSILRDSKHSVINKGYCHHRAELQTSSLKPGSWERIQLSFSKVSIVVFLLLWTISLQSFC